MNLLFAYMSLLIAFIALQSCASTTANPGVYNQPYTTPTIQKQSYIFRSPPPVAIQARALAR
ncbi:MAG TPA: hypothetical protein VL360_02100 [Gammaproteobacteria bacterium]|nr:hypothetical protein [Gammaproteobacteria bacterium]